MLRFWDSELHFWRKSRRNASFWASKFHCVKEVSQKCFVFDFQSVIFEGSLAQKLRFWASTLRFLKEVSHKSFVWQNHLNHTSVDNHITWTSNHLASKPLESQINWQPNHLNLMSFEADINWLSNQLNSAHPLPIGSLSLETSAAASCGRYVMFLWNLIYIYIYRLGMARPFNLHHAKVVSGGPQFYIQLVHSVGFRYQNALMVQVSHQESVKVSFICTKDSMDFSAESSRIIWCSCCGLHLRSWRWPAGFVVEILYLNRLSAGMFFEVTSPTPRLENAEQLHPWLTGGSSVRKYLGAVLLRSRRQCEPKTEQHVGSSRPFSGTEERPAFLSKNVPPWHQTAPNNPPN